MKPVKLTIKNVGIIKDTVIDINKPLILFYGDLAQGKTTLLNAFKWCLGGSFPTDIIRHGEKEASVMFEFSEDTGPGSITRSWYFNKEEIATARPVAFIRAGKPVSDAAKEIKKFLNPYLLDNEFLKKMNEKETNAYFVQLFGVDTSEEDKAITKAAIEAQTLRIKIKMYGEIDRAEVKPVDMSVLQSKKQAILYDHAQLVENTDNENTTIRELNNMVTNHTMHLDRIVDEINDIDKEMESLQGRKTAASTEMKIVSEWLKTNNAQEEKPRPVTPDTSEIDNKISEAAAIAVKVEQYQKNLKRAQEKTADEAALSALEAKQRELKKAKTAKLSSMGEKSGIKGLIFSEDGFTYNGTSAGMLSTSQIMDLSQDLSALFPAGFGLDLLDRAESLGFAIGKNIIEFIEKAKREEKTILAAIVGERPAIVPPEVGVFVVKDGVVL